MLIMSKSESQEVVDRLRVQLVNGEGKKVYDSADKIPDIGFPREPLKFCPNCIKPETIIPGDYQPMGQLTERNMCIGTEQLQQVQETMYRRYSGNLVKIHASGLLPIESTPEHPLLTCRSITNKHRGVIVGFSNPAWLPANQLTPKKTYHDGDYLMIPRVIGQFEDNSFSLLPFTNLHGLHIAAGRNCPTEYPLTVESAWLIGLYIAEGVSFPKGIRFILGKHETALQKRVKHIIQNIGYHCNTQQKRTAIEIEVASRLLSRLFHSLCGKRAENKRIPEKILFHKNKKLLQALLDGYISGDGCEDVHRIRTKTVSNILALQLQLAYARLGKFATISCGKEGKHNIEGRIVSVKRNYELNISKGNRPQARVFSNFVLTPVRSVSNKKYDGSVCNIRTPDNTYLVSNAIVHNCGGETQAIVYMCKCCGTRFLQQEDRKTGRKLIITLPANEMPIDHSIV